MELFLCILTIGVICLACYYNNLKDKDYEDYLEEYENENKNRTL